MARILMIDDQEDIVFLVEQALTMANHHVDGFTSVEQVSKEKINQYDLILLDIMMPGIDGLHYCEEIRSLVDCPIIFLTAKTQETDIVQGLAYGADDYICKPFGIQELQARVSAHLRREHREHHAAFVIGAFRFDLSAKVLYVGDTSLDLTRSEYGICQFLAESKGQVFTRDQIYTHLYGYEEKGSPAAVAEHIKNIRAKLRDVGQSPIETVWGIGYRWQ